MMLRFSHGSIYETLLTSCYFYELAGSYWGQICHFHLNLEIKQSLLSKIRHGTSC